MTPSVHVEAQDAGIAALPGLQGRRGVTTAQDGVGQGSAGGVASLQRARWSEAFLAQTSLENGGPGSRNEMQRPAQGSGFSALWTNEEATDLGGNPYPNRTVQALDTTGDKLTRQSRSPLATPSEGAAELGAKKSLPTKASPGREQELSAGALPFKRQDSRIVTVDATGLTGFPAELLVQQTRPDSGLQGQGTHPVIASDESRPTVKLLNAPVSALVVDSLAVGRVNTSWQRDGLLHPLSISSSDKGDAARFEDGPGAEMKTSSLQPFKATGRSVPLVQATGAAALRTEAEIGTLNEMSAERVALPVTSRVAGAVDLPEEQKPELAASAADSAPGIRRVGPGPVARASVDAVRPHAVSSSGVTTEVSQDEDQSFSISSMPVARETTGIARQAHASNRVDQAGAIAEMKPKLLQQWLAGADASTRRVQAGDEVTLHPVASLRPASEGITVNNFVEKESVIRLAVPVVNFETAALARGVSEASHSASQAAATSVGRTAVAERQGPISIQGDASLQVGAHPLKAEDYSPSVSAEQPAVLDREAISSPDTRVLSVTHAIALSAPAGGISKVVEGVAPPHSNTAVSSVDTEVAGHSDTVTGGAEFNTLKPTSFMEVLPVRGSETGTGLSTRLASGKPKQIALLSTEPDSKTATGALPAQARSGSVFGAESGAAQSLSVPFVPGMTSAPVAVLHGPLPSGSEGTRDPFHAMDSVDAASSAAALRDMASSRSADSVHSLEVGYQDPSLGYVELHAHMAGSGVHASLMAQSSSSEAVLEGHLGSLAGWMQERHTPVESLTVSVLRGDMELHSSSGGHTPANAEDGQGQKDGLNQGSSDALRAAGDRGQIEDRRRFVVSQAADVPGAQLILSGARGLHISLMA